MLCVFSKLIPTSTELWNCLTQHILGLFTSGCFDPIKYWRLQENLFNIQIKLEIRSETFCSFLKKKATMKPNSYYLTDDFILGAETFEKFHGILVERMRDKMANDILILSWKYFWTYKHPDKMWMLSGASQATLLRITGLVRRKRKSKVIPGGPARPQMTLYWKDMQ